MRRVLAFAADRTAPTAVTWWFAPVGGFLAAVLLFLLGAPVTFAWWLPDNAILRGAFDVLVCVVVAYIVMFLAWIAVAPIHFRLKDGSGISAVLKRMWPQYLMVFSGIGFFVGLVGFLQTNVSPKPPIVGEERTNPRPLENLRPDQLRDMTTRVAQGLRQLEMDYNNKQGQFSIEFYRKRRQAISAAEQTEITDQERASMIALGNEKDKQFRNNYRADVIMLRDEYRARLGELPIYKRRPFGPQGIEVPADSPIFDKPFLAGPDPLSSGADILEYWAKHLH